MVRAVRRQGGNYHFNYLHRRTPAKCACGGMLTCDSRHADLWQILPVGPRASEVVHTTYLRPGLSEAERATMTEMAPWICETVVDGEDFWVAGRTEPGPRAAALDTMVFGRNEPAPQHLHRGFAAALAEAAGRRGGASAG